MVWEITRCFSRRPNESADSDGDGSVTIQMPSVERCETEDTDGDGVGDNADVFPMTQTSLKTAMETVLATMKR